MPTIYSDSDSWIVTLDNQANLASGSISATYTASNVVYNVSASLWGSLGQNHIQSVQYQPTIFSSQQALQYQWYTYALKGLGAYSETPEGKVAREMWQAARKAAEMRAEKLLFTILKPAQVKQYSDDGYFDTDINGRIYRLHKRSRSMNVELIEAGRATMKFCAHPDNAHEVHIPDVLLSQLLMLQCSEKAFLQIANQRVIQ